MQIKLYKEGKYNQSKRAWVLKNPIAKTAEVDQVEDRAALEAILGPLDVCALQTVAGQVQDGRVYWLCTDVTSDNWAWALLQ